MPQPWTKVYVSLFKPEGYGITYFVNTDNRGKAARMVLDKVENEANCGLKFLNDVVCHLCSEQEAKITNRNHILI